MALVVKSASAAFTKSLGSVIYPVSRGLVGLYFFGSNRANQLINGVAGAARLTVIGSPTINAETVTVSNVNGYDTGLLETASQTLISISKRPTLTAGQGWPVVGNNNATGTDTDLGSHSGHAAAASYFFTATGIATPGQTFGYYVKSDVVVGDAVMIGSVIDNAVPNMRTYVGYKGVLASTNTAYGTRALDSEYTTKIGAHAGSYAPFRQSGEVYCAAVHNVALTDPEMAQVATWLRAQYRALGIVTL